MRTKLEAHTRDPMRAGRLATERYPMEPTEQAPDTRRPKKRKRRWLIVALMLVSVVSWWYWPRGDARFVGKWENLLASPDGTNAISVGQKELWSNGTGRMLAGPPQKLTHVLYFDWRVEGGYFLIGNGGESDSERLLTRVQDWVWSHLGYGVVTSGSHYRIIETTSGEIRLEPADSPDIEILRRIPE